MRNESEMFELILDIAHNDERIRALYMNGSRVNPKVKKDIYQDYDIVFVVTETASFLNDKHWVSVFGDIAMVQEPDSNDFAWGMEHDCSQSYGWLILFKDGNRIDLHIEVEEVALKTYGQDSLTRMLLDKDGILPKIQLASDASYWIQAPTQAQFLGCYNEFWWCLNNVAKGVARDQLPYAMRMYTQVVHTQLDQMIEWSIAMNDNFEMTTGMWGKYFKDYLTPEYYEMYIKTYSTCDDERLWEAIFMATRLFRLVANQVAHQLGLTYNISDDENMMAYLTAVKKESLEIV